MKKLTIDGRDVEVADNATILEAAEAAGVKIPTLCHDPRLTPYGACRMCLVEVEGNAKLLPACTSPAENGMKVLSTTEKIKGIRQTVLEFLLVHHPLDCPVCDSAGECDLQDMVFENEVKENRFKGKKKDYATDSRNPLVERDLNRCILCAKCVRICNEVQGVGAIGLVWRGFDTEIAPPFGQSLDCEFCGQCIAVCPVGSLTSKLFKFKTRSWLLDRHESACPHCSTGCTLFVETKDNKVYRTTAEYDRGINEGNLCPKGRFGYEYVDSEDRLETPLLRQGQDLAPTDWDTALTKVAEQLKQAKEQFGPATVAALASPRLSNEDNYLLQKLMRAGMGSNNIDSIAGYGHRGFVDGSMAVFGTLNGTPDYKSLLEAKTLLVVGSNVTETNPVVGNFLLKAKNKRDARLICLSSRGSKLTRHADLWVRNRPGTDADVLAGLADRIIQGGLGSGLDAAKKLEGFDGFAKSVKAQTPAVLKDKAGVSAEDLDALAEALTADGPALIVLTLHSAENTKGYQTYLAAAGLSLVAGQSKAGEPGVLALGETCNIQGLLDVGAAPDLLPGLAPLDDGPARAALEKEWGAPPPAEKGMTVEEMLTAAEGGKIKVLYIAGENPLVNFPDTSRVRKALEKVEFLVVQDLFKTETAELAHVVLPAASFAEKSGTVTSAEFRVNTFGAGLDPRGEARADWRIFADLLGLLDVPGDTPSVETVTDEIARVAPALAKALGKPGERWNADASGSPDPSLVPLSLNGAVETTDEHPFLLLTGALLNHSGTVTRKGAGLLKVTPEAFAHLSPEDAEKLGFKEGDKVKIIGEARNVSAKVKVTDDVPKGSVFMPIHFASPQVNSLTSPPGENRERVPAKVRVEVEKGVFQEAPK